MSLSSALRIAIISTFLYAVVSAVFVTQPTAVSTAECFALKSTELISQLTTFRASVIPAFLVAHTSANWDALYTTKRQSVVPAKLCPVYAAQYFSERSADRSAIHKSQLSTISAPFAPTFKCAIVAAQCTTLVATKWETFLSAYDAAQFLTKHPALVAPIASANMFAVLSAHCGSFRAAVTEAFCAANLQPHDAAFPSAFYAAHDAAIT